MDSKTVKKISLLIKFEHIKNSSISLNNRDKIEPEGLISINKSLISRVERFEQELSRYLGMDFDEAVSIIEKAKKDSEVSYDEVLEDIEKLPKEEREFIKNHLSNKED